MSVEVKILLVSGTIGAVVTTLFMLFFNKTNFGKKELREEIEEGILAEKHNKSLQ